MSSRKNSHNNQDSRVSKREQQQVRKKVDIQAIQVESARLPPSLAGATAPNQPNRLDASSTTKARQDSAPPTHEPGPPSAKPGSYALEPAICVPERAFVARHALCAAH